MTTQDLQMTATAGLAPRFAAAIRLLDRFPDSLLLLTARIAVAGVFWKSGQTKLANWDLTVALFADEYRVPLLPPETAALLGTAAELICPVLLVLGLAARLGAAGLLGVTFVIQAFVYPESWLEHLGWTAMLLLVLTRGAGALSLDRLIAGFFPAGRGR